MKYRDQVIGFLRETIEDPGFKCMNGNSVKTLLGLYDELDAENKLLREGLKDILDNYECGWRVDGMLEDLLK